MNRIRIQELGYHGPCTRSLYAPFSTQHVVKTTRRKVGKDKDAGQGCLPRHPSDNIAKNSRFRPSSIPPEARPQKSQTKCENQSQTPCSPNRDSKNNRSRERAAQEGSAPSSQFPSPGFSHARHCPRIADFAVSVIFCRQSPRPCVFVVPFRFPAPKENIRI